MDNFEFSLIDDFPGYVSAKDKTLLPMNYLVRGSINVYKKISGTIASRCGLKRRGEIDAVLVSAAVPGTPSAEVVVDSYSESNKDTDLNLKSTIPYRYQTFSCATTVTIEKALLYLKNTSGATGDVIAYIYAITGTSGTTGKPTGLPLATSVSVDASTIGASYSLVEFGFGSSVQLDAGTDYVLVIYHRHTRGISVGADGSSPSHAGNSGYSLTGTTWTVGSQDICFYVYGNTIAIPDTPATYSPTLGGVKASFEWNTSLGASRPLRVCNGKLQVESDVLDGSTLVWYDLITGLAEENTRFVFDTWWNDTNKKDIVLMVNHTTNIKQWGGGIAVMASMVTDPLGVYTWAITKRDTDTTWSQDGFVVNDNILINGNTYHIEAFSADGLTLYSNTAGTAEANNSVVLDKYSERDAPVAGVFVCDFIKVLHNQLLVGSYTNRTLYLSADTDFGDFTNTGGLITGDPDSCILDNNPTGLAVRSGSFIASAGDADWYIITPNSPLPLATVIPGSSPAANRYVEMKIEKKSGSGLTAALAHEFIDVIGDDVIFLAKDHQVRVFATLRNLAQPKYPSLSQQIADELTAEDFTGGHLRCIGDYIFITAPVNGRHWMYQRRESISQEGNVIAERLWHPPQLCSISRFAVIESVIYGHSNANPQIYQIFDTNQWDDDSPSGEQIPFLAVARFAYGHLIPQKNFPRRQGKLAFSKVYLEGYISNGVSLLGNSYLDYQGATGQAALVFNSVASPLQFYSGSVALPIGSKSLGDNPIGDGLVTDTNDQELLPKFRAICLVTPVNCYEYQLEVYSYETGSRWEILSIGVNLTEVSEQAVELTK